MPNHVHGIVAVGARHAVPLPSECERFAKPVSASLPTIIRSFKSACSKQINELGSEHPGPVWQRNYFEHLIRNEDSLSRIRQYILDNPMRWEFDRENPLAMKPEADYAWRQ
jgi:REP element-mobilizing transposase RayT